MKITISPSKPQDEKEPGLAYPTIVIDHPSDELDVSQAVELFISALVAWGYQSTSINDVLMGLSDAQSKQNS